MKVSGSSIFEVIVASLIVMIVFVLFSALFGQVITERSVVSEVKLLNSFNPAVYPGGLNADYMKQNCPNCRLLQTEITSDEYSIKKVSIVGAVGNDTVFTRYQIVNPSKINLIFQR